MEEANKINDDIWAMNANILLGQCDSKCDSDIDTYIFLVCHFRLKLFLLVVPVKTMNLDRALTCFEQAEENAVKCANKGNASLLREAQQCLKVWIEKRENKSTEQQGSPQDSQGSDQSLDEKDE